MKCTLKLIAVILIAVIIGGCGTSETIQETSALESDAAVAEEQAVTESTAASSADTVWLSMATSGNWEDIARGEIWNEYCDKLAEWSGGELRIRSYFNGSLGNDLELIEGAKEGTLSIINSVPSYQISVVPEAALLDVPGLFDSTEE